MAIDLRKYPQVKDTLMVVCLHLRFRCQWLYATKYYPCLVYPVKQWLSDPTQNLKQLLERAMKWV